VSNEPLRVGIIGCGGRGRAHALGYAQSDRVRIAACADKYLPAAERLAAQWDVPAVYDDYRKMLAEEKLDIVSMALWPDLHYDAVMACVHAPHPPRLINAEKPMAPTYGEARRMHEACEQAGIMLTFSHQRRFGPLFATARRLIREGAVGDLVRLEGYCSNLFDWGTHWFDMMQFYNDDLPPDWVMGQVDVAEERLVFGALVETSGLSYVKWPNGVTGLLATGVRPGGGCQNRIIGTEGVIEITSQEVRLLRNGVKGWETPTLPDWRHPGGDTTRYILDSIDCLLEGRESILSSRHALQATALIFATYESARRRAKVLLPLDIEDSPLLSMIESGEIIIPDWPAFLTEEEEAEGWRLLFNGRDLTGWAPSEGAPAAAWFVKGGLLRCAGAGGTALRTTEEFGDFSLAFSWRHRTSRGRCEVCVRTGLAVVLADDRHDPPSTTSTGSVNGVLAPDKNVPRSPSAWTETEITCRGTLLRIAVNGDPVLECKTHETPPLIRTPACGCIEFRDLGFPMDFRDIRIRPL